MEKKDFKVYGYRWVVLIVFMLINLVIQLQWLAHAGIARPAVAFFEANGAKFNSFYNVDSLAIIYMFVFLIFCVPASFIIDKFGIRWGIGVGSFIALISAIIKGFFATNFNMVFIGQVGFAIAQPFVLNAYTALCVKWFPLKERGTAVGLASLSQYLGIIVAVAVTPPLFYKYGMVATQKSYGIFTAIVCLLAIIFIKENPPTPPSAEKLERFTFTKGIKNMFHQKDMILTIIMFFIGFGIFNAVSSMTDGLNSYLNVEDSDGMIAGLMIIGGILGAVIIPILSDKLKKRKAFLVICIMGMFLGVSGLTGAKYLNPYSYEWEVLSIPEGSEVSIAKSDDGIQLITPDSDGLYHFNYKVFKKDEVVENRNIYILATMDKDITEYTIEDGKTIFLYDEEKVKNMSDAEFFKLSETKTQTSSNGEVRKYWDSLFLQSSSIDDKSNSIVYKLALIAAFILGFFVMSAGPVGFQYATEVTYPTPEATSQGVLLLAGQISGLFFTWLMGFRSNTYLGLVMIGFCILSLIAIVMTLLLGESPIIITEKDKAEGKVPKV